MRPRLSNAIGARLRPFTAGEEVVQICNTNGFGPIDGARTVLLPRAHAQEHHHRNDSGFRGFAAAVVALELGVGGRPLVAMA